MTKSCAYRIGDFTSAERIAVLCRGQSVAHVSHNNDFTYCYIVGQFDHTLPVIGQHLKNKKIVQIINKSTIKVNRKICSRFGIKDIQCNFTGWLNAPLSVTRQRIYEDIQKKNPWAKVHVAPPGIRERRPCDKEGYIGWQTTGVYAVDLASFWEPKKVWIFGLDFYAVPYYKKEKVHISLKKNKKRQKEMLYNFTKIVEHNPNISFSLFTKCRNISSNSANLIVHQV